MEVHVGTSGFSYDFWKGEFYPADIKSADMLAYYATQANTVELNNTFYRMPKPDVVQRWADAVPESFRFVIKASRRITHSARLKDASSVDYLFKVLEPLGEKLGPVLFQCPPFLRKDTSLLTEFLGSLPSHASAVLEFRHDSWFAEDVYEVLRARRASLCIGDYEGKSRILKGGQTPRIKTAPWAYLRLREEQYDDDALREWAEAMLAQWESCFVFFKHEETAPGLVSRFAAIAQEVVGQQGS